MKGLFDFLLCGRSPILQYCEEPSTLNPERQEPGRNLVDWMRN